jgi:hypothetical protein
MTGELHAQLYMAQEGLDECPFCAAGTCWVHAEPTYDPRELATATPEMEARLQEWATERLAVLAPDIWEAIQRTPQAPPTPTTADRLLALESEMRSTRTGTLVQAVMERLGEGSPESCDWISTPTSLPPLPCLD